MVRHGLCSGRPGAAQYAGILKELEALSDDEVRALLAAEQNGTSGGKPQT